MATMVSGLGGAAGYGEQSFKTSTLSGGNLDDGFIQVNVTSVFGCMTIGTTNYTSIFISTNGLITFNSGVTAYAPTALTSLGQPSLSPFWTDADITKGGDIYWDLDPATGKITITWADVAAFTGPGTNSFQVIITSTGNGDFTVEYIYEEIGYTNGYQGHAVTGFSNGTTQTLLEGSGDPAILSTYANNDFDTNDPAGVYGLGFEGGTSFTGDGVVDGTAGNDNIGAGYTGDPDGDRIDMGDATGFGGTTGDGDYVLAGQGNDTVQSGLGNDIVFGGDGNDSVLAGYGNDTADGGANNDTLDGQSGNDSLEGGAGDDQLFGGAAQTGISYTANYIEITNPTQQVTGTNGRSNFTVQSISNENNLLRQNNSGVTGYRIGNGDSVETHTHTASSQIAGGQLLFNGIDTNEQMAIQIDGVTVNLNTAIANGSVTFNGAGVYGVNGSGQIVRTSGTTANPTTVGTLTINVPYTSLTVVSTGSNTNGTTSGFFYDYFVNTQPMNVAAEAGGNDTLSGGAGNDLLYAGDGNDSLLGGDDNDQLFGGTGNDVLSGDGGDDILYGEDGDDTAAGGLGADSLFGAAGADSLAGDGGADTIFGGDNGDVISGGSENDSLYGDAGADTISGGDNDDRLFGGTENDSLSGDGGNDTLQGDAGEDTLAGGLGADSLLGGTGNDSLLGDGGNDTLSGGDDNDRLFGGAENDSLSGDNGNDSLFGGDHDDRLSGGIGNDSLSGDAGNDTLLGDAGNDTLVGGTGVDVADYSASTAGVIVDLQAGTGLGGDAAGDVLSLIENLIGSGLDDRLLGDDATGNTLWGGAGNDSLEGRGGNDSLVGGTGADSLFGGTGADTLQGDDGNDSLVGGDDGDLLQGGAGNDVLSGDAGDDTLFGGNDADSLTGGAGNDSLVGDAGADTLAGGDNADQLFGGSENDSLYGDAGADSLFGGDNDDRLFGGTENDSLSGDAGNDTLQGDAGDDTLVGGLGTDSLLGGAGIDSLVGDAGADSLFGGDDADRLFGGADNDSLSGDAGDDTLVGGAGSDTLSGGSGVDLADYSASATGVTVDLQAGTGTGGDAAGDSLSGIEAVLGTAQGDTLLGDSATGNSLTGGAGNDSLDGRGGDDSLYGGTGDDTLIGGDGNDLLEGGDGNDLIFAGAGADTLSGGIGNDAIFGVGIGDVIDGGENAGDYDTVDLSDWGWKRTKITYAPGNAENGVVEFLDTAGNVLGSLQFSNIEKMIPCFTPGTRVMTRQGEVRVEDLRAGDEVLTRDGGFRPLVWTGRRDLTAADLAAQPALRPIRIAAGALGGGLPERDMLVSPQHRMLVEGHRAEMLFGETEVLVSAKHLVGMEGVAPALTDGVSYIHIMFDRHEIVCADGAWSESFQPSRRMLGGMEADVVEELLAIFPELAEQEVPFQSARLSLKAHEVRVLLAA